MEKEIIIDKYITDNCALYNGDCLEVMDMLIEKGVKVDAIICDPPYQVTNCAWDSIIPFDKMWERLNKLIKDNGAIVLFGSEPFSSSLRMSNIKNYKYDWIYEKTLPTGFLNAHKRPLKVFENIIIFYEKQCVYNPQMKHGYKKYKAHGGNKHDCYGKFDNSRVIENNGERFPTDIITYKKDKCKYHPTQKPIALMEYLIKTYTNEGDLVLDFTMGSGSTCVAARNTNRKSIGIELEKEYFDIAVSRYKDEEIVKESKEEKKEELKLASWKK